MVARNGAQGRTQQVYGQLRAGIINGSYSPGAPLRLAELSGSFGVSMSVIREALIRLAEQHLVVLAPNQGFRVAETSRDDLIDLTELRITLETLALRNSIEHGPVAWEAEVVAAHHVLERATLSVGEGVGTTDEWSIAHMHFHHALGSACGSPRLIGMIETLRDGSELYRQRSALAGSASSRDVVGEHRELMLLATTRRAEEAAASLEQHLRRTSEALLAADF